MFIFTLQLLSKKILLAKWHKDPSSFILFLYKYCLVISKVTLLLSIQQKIQKVVLFSFVYKNQQHSKHLNVRLFDFCFVFLPYNCNIFFKNEKTPQMRVALSKSQQKPCCRRKNLGRDFLAENIRCRGKREQTFTLQ